MIGQLESAVAVVVDAQRGEADGREEGRQTLEMNLFPSGVEEVIVALRTINTLPEKGTDRSSSQLLLVDLLVDLCDRDEVGLGITGRQTVAADQVGDDAIPRSVGCDLLGQPRMEPVPAEGQEGPLFGSDQGSTQSLGQVGRAAAVGQKSLCPPLKFQGAAVSVELSDLLE